MKKLLLLMIIAGTLFSCSEKRTPQHPMLGQGLNTALHSMNLMGHLI